MQSQIAGDGRGLILPVLLERADVPPLLRQFHWLDLRDGDVERAVTQLAAAIRRWSGVFHPPGTEAQRGPLRSCRFYISPLYHKQPRWRSLGDLLVELIDASARGEVYLIPSGLAAPRLRHSAHLRAHRDSLRMTCGITRQFVEQCEDRALEGERFAIATRGEQYTAVYAAEYDRFLNARLAQHAGS